MPRLGTLLIHAPALALLTWTGLAAAQDEPRPNILLLVDTSGSMEYRTGFTSAGEQVFPRCDPAQPRVEEPCGADRQIGTELCFNNEKSRWVELVEVLTGTVPNYRCEALSRRPLNPISDFQALYRLAGQDPPDINYPNPFHRLLTVYTSGTETNYCIPGPASPNPNDALLLPLASRLPLEDIVWRDRASTAPSPATGGCSDLDDNDPTHGFGRGLLDVFGNEVRFALMTFDTEQELETGATSFANGIDGAWDYLSSADGPRVGRPVGCEKDAPMNVGARGQWAPGWEGRLIGFGDPTKAEADLDRNRAIQRVLLATRPYGATPIAGMLHDAYQFLFEDTTLDEVGGKTHTLGPRLGANGDPFAADDCRSNAVILLTDGEPNMDLRPECVDAGTGSEVNCPYPTPEVLASKLLTGANSAKVPVYVVGFSLAKVTIGGIEKSCSALDAATDCSEATLASLDVVSRRALEACCLLNRIAVGGGTDGAYFADNRDELENQLRLLLDKLTANAAARTRPVFASATEYATGNISFRFFTGFAPRFGELRRGVIERKRIVCREEDGELVPKEETLDVALGDDFVANVNLALGEGRKLFTYESKATGTDRSSLTLRPGKAASSTGDTIADDGGYFRSGETPLGDNYASFIVAPEALGLAGTGTCPLDSTLSAPACRNGALKWLFGEPNGLLRSRCEGGVCNLLADVYRSTPVLVGRPNALISDETYRIFASDATSYRAASRGAGEEEGTPDVHRPLVLYTSTNDGMLHAFRVFPPADIQEGETALEALDRERSELNELWAFIPPAMLPLIPKLYPSNRHIVLDGEPVVRDVVATPLQTTVNLTTVPTATSYPWKLERKPSAAQSGGTTWRTVLVQGFGDSLAGGGYYALDVTDPETGPRFLWQLTRDGAGQPLFGKTIAAPLITTLYVTQGQQLVELPVAVLPGGLSQNAAAPSGSCTAPTEGAFKVDTDYPLRKLPLRCFTSTEPSRSLTIVRLDSGEILATFRYQADDAPTGLATSVIHSADILAPISGRPAAFPAGVGAIADRLYVGDAEGILWRVDLSSPVPDNWKMEPFFDGYTTQDVATGDMGQPILTAPVVSTDSDGSVIVSFSTGDQDTDGDAGDVSAMRTYLWSVREREVVNATGNVATVSFQSQALWDVELLGRERVSGPLQLFDGTLYFTTFRPVAGSGVCTTGESKVWGLDFVVPQDASDKASGGLARYPTEDPDDPFTQCVTSTTNTTSNPNQTKYPCEAMTLEEGNVIYGVTVAQLPSCVESASSDSFMGNTQHTSVSSIRPGKFQLLMQTGTTGSVTELNPTGARTVDLPTPKTTPIIESWAALLE